MKAIPAGPLPLCQALDALSESTWLELQLGVKTAQCLGEESITDYNLMRLAACVSSVVVEKHTKRREAKSGADWELWAGRSGALIGMRVQAKLLHHDTCRYESLYSSKRTLLTQIDKLIGSALGASRPLFPLFSFYNYCGRALSTGGASCPRLSAAPLLAGWTVASATAIRQRLLEDDSKHFANFRDLMLPISCLFCCPADCQRLSGPRPPSLAEAVSARLRDAWSDSLPSLVSALTPGVGPVYVERLIKGERAESGWGSFPRELRRLFTRARELPTGISRVAIIRDTPGAA